MAYLLANAFLKNIVPYATSGQVIIHVALSLIACNSKSFAFVIT